MIGRREKVKKTFSKNKVVCPNFLYIGAEKAGSSWIYEILREHPQVFVPVAKDIQFFDKNYDKGIEWYLSLFKSGAGQRAVGEVSHDYFLAEETAVLIQKHLPGVRLICCLREPIERTMSSFLFYRTTVLDKRTTFAEFAFDDRILKLSDYYYNLYPFYQRFPRQNILVLYFDDLKKNPRLFAQRIYKFLKVDPDFQPKILYQKVLPASEPRFGWIAHLVYQVGLFLRKVGLVNVVGTVKRTGTFRGLFYRELERKPEIPAAIRQKLKAYYTERYRELPILIGQPLPEAWGFEQVINPQTIE
ncbi:MAG: sulfotransferase domain-containing protein [Anaerolineae bacterium]|nr:sulfotransferase domain-containing protein [Anaerolineae bacterium]